MKKAHWCHEPDWKHWKIQLTGFVWMAALLSSFLEAGVLENSNAYLLDKLSLGVSAHLHCLLCESDDYKWKKWNGFYELHFGSVTKQNLARRKICKYFLDFLICFTWRLISFYTTNNLSTKTVPISVPTHWTLHHHWKLVFLLLIHSVNIIVLLCFVHPRADRFW